MTRTLRHDNGLNRGRDDKQFGARCAPSSRHPKGYDSRDDDHGHYGAGAGGARVMKKLSSRAQRRHHDRALKVEVLGEEWNRFCDENGIPRGCALEALNDVMSGRVKTTRAVLLKIEEFLERFDADDEE